MKVAIIGAGPSGLATLKYLVTAHEYFDGLEPITVRLFEAETDIGGTFRYRTYRDSELVSSKYLTAFSDHRFPADAPDFATPESYLGYLEGYIDKFGLKEHIECGCEVLDVSRAADGGHIVRIESRRSTEVASPSGRHSQQPGDASSEIEDWHCDAVVVCSGLNLNPNVPEIPGLTVKDPYKPPCPTIHSSSYKSAAFFDKAQTVVVLGAGETAMDIAHQAVNHADVQKVVLCSRDGFLVAPKVVPEPVILGVWGRPYPGRRLNKPIDTTVASLFDTAYVPPCVQRGPLLWLFYDRWIKYVFFLIAGSSQGIDQWVGGVPARRRYADSLFLVKSDKAVPYMSAGLRKGFWNAVRSFLINVPIRDTGGRTIEVKAWPTHMADDGVLSIPEEGKETAYQVKPDRVVLATGYRTEFSFLRERQYPTLAEARVRGIYRDIEDGFAYIGFVRPAVGAIPPLAELQAQLWVYRWLQHRHSNTLARRKDITATVSTNEHTALLVDDRKKNNPTAAEEAEESVVAPYELDYALHARGGYDVFATKRGVDHESYAYQLALDIGSAATAGHVARRTGGWRCAYAWAMGPNFNTKFRLVGPWARPHVAVPIMEGELYGVVRRTGGLFFFFTYTVLPFVFFGCLSIGFMLFQWLSASLARLREIVVGLVHGDEGE